MLFFFFKKQNKVSQRAIKEVFTEYASAIACVMTGLFAYKC